jgi:hypothetical protein
MPDVGWITMHRWRFAAPQSMKDLDIPTPAGAAHAIFGCRGDIGPDGMAVVASEVWGGTTHHETRAGAEALFADPDTAFPDLPPVIEAWHGLLRPFRFKGVNEWFKGTDVRLVPAEQDPGGPLAVITSAGYDRHDPSQVPRMRGFYAGIVKVQEAYEAMDGNIVQAYFRNTRKTDGQTFTIWRDDAAMMSAAYRAGRHRSEMDYHHGNPPGYFDRSSFLRSRILDHKGSWDGRDPVAEIATLPV